jgi:proteasome-associated ATPase
VPDYRRLLEEAQEKLREQDEFIKQLVAPVHIIGVVHQLKEKAVVVQAGGDIIELDRPFMFSENNKSLDYDLVPGQRVCLNLKTRQIERVTEFIEYGDAGTIESIDDGIIEVVCERGSKFIRSTQVPNLKVGDRVVLDSTDHTVLAKIKPKDSKHQFYGHTAVDWTSVGGLREAKEELKLAIEEPIKNAKVFKFFGKNLPKGFLLHGRPGNGKTLLGKAVATAMGKLHGADGGAFLYVKGPELLSKWFGESEEQIRSLFITARKHKAKHGYPAVIFIDESDALLHSRDKHQNSSLAHTIVPQFLSEMDGLEESAALVLLATNRADTLDPAITRPGRIDRKIYVGAPDEASATEIFHIHMRNVPIAETDNHNDLVRQAVKRLYSNQDALYTLKTHLRDLSFGLRELSSGAFIAGVVEHAVSFAVMRNLNQKNLSGVCWDDFEKAFCRIRKEQFGMNHETELKEYIETNGLNVEAIVPLRY